MKSRSKGRKIDYTALTAHERVRLALHALLRDDEDEGRWLEATTPRKTYVQYDPVVVDTWHRIWSVAYRFRDAMTFLEGGRDLGVVQVLSAARRVLSEEQVGLVTAAWIEARAPFCGPVEGSLASISEPSGRGSLCFGEHEGPDPATSEHRDVPAHYEFHFTRALLIAGLRAFAKDAGLLIDEVLAPLPNDHREALLASINRRPEWLEIPDELARQAAEMLANAPLRGRAWPK